MSKVKVMKKQMADPELSTMFNQMLGEGNPEIIAAKFENLKKQLKFISKILETFADGPLKGFQSYSEWLQDFRVLGTKILDLVNSSDLDYVKLKNNNLTKQTILICKELTEYNKRLGNERWIVDHPGLVFEPFAFTKFDIKHLWNNELTTPAVKTYVLKIVGLLYDNCHAIYKIISSPDIDVKKF